MTNVLRASALLGLPVVTIDAGEDVAEVRDVLYSSERHELLGFTLNKRGRLAGRLDRSLPVSGVSAIGADAVMVDDEDALSGEADLAGRADGSAPVIGNRVVSSSGDVLGEVVGVILTTGTSPTAVGYEISTPESDDTAFIPISAQVALSGDNLMVPDEATEFIRNDLAGFGAAVEDYRASAMHGADRAEPDRREGADRD